PAVRLANRGLKTRSARPIKPPGMKKAQPSISTALASAPRTQAARINQGARLPTLARATPETKNAAITNSGSASATAFDTDMNDSNVAVEDMILTWRFGFIGGAAERMGEGKHILGIRAT